MNEYRAYFDRGDMALFFIFTVQKKKSLLSNYSLKREKRFSLT